MGSKKSIRLVLTALLFALLLFPAQNAMAGTVAEGSATLESLHTDSTQGDGDSYRPSISADGRYIAFESEASTLVDGDINDSKDIFLRDTTEGTTTLVSVAASYGAPYGYGADLGSSSSAISGDGQYVAFDSNATNLVAGGTYGQQVFVRDTVGGTTALVSPNYGGTYGAHGYGANGNSAYPSISFGGRYVAFQSYATNLTDDGATSYSAIFIRDTQEGATTRIMAYGGAQPDNNSYYPAISGDGSAVGFQSRASNLLEANNPDTGDQNIYVYDTASGAIELISRAYGSALSEEITPTYGANGGCDNPVISYGGRYVAFYSYATNLVYGGSNGEYQVYVYDRTSGEMVVASAEDGGTSEGNNTSDRPSISPDGRYVAFRSQATNLVTDVTEYTSSDYLVFLRDTVDQKTTLISRIDNTVGGYEAGVYGGGINNAPSVSDCGMYVAFGAAGSYFVEGDTNGNSDIFRVLNDTDGDGIGDMDTDGDGTPDCVDLCPDDPDKIEPGACGCGVADTDADGNGIADCLEDDEEPAPRLPDTDIGPDCFISTLVF
ncbi:PD40 domain-containing protein [Desulfosudis oleivorans]|uniref:WD40 domain protein beta propeller n=1 Tax=Desulfosudis oleivorans (strain DSM 6200 / JCM 39069 / Hxd3) TaxID=96561 RepID=A8ZZP8_DESOH|nr:PD40 domain-containing protein [Desulfosudis oleivorans]ABW68920.1 WD40 domain protein beta propeller [Desulfosudis oleivorans Hxd3]